MQASGRQQSINRSASTPVYASTSDEIKLQFKNACLIMRSRQDRKIIRDQLNLELREAFREMVLRNSDKRLSWDIYRWQIHHIVPILFGGTNNPRNLTLVHPDIHKRIHAKIDTQTAGMQVGSRRYVNIPYLPGKLWGPN